MSEYLNNVGRRAELRQEAVTVRIAAESHFQSLRLALDPMTPMAELDVEKIVTLAAALAERITEAQEIQAKLKAIRDIIGE